jgi:hypothetical protein
MIMLIAPMLPARCVMLSLRVSKELFWEGNVPHAGGFVNRY